MDHRRRSHSCARPTRVRREVPFLRASKCGSFGTVFLAHRPWESRASRTQNRPIARGIRQRQREVVRPEATIRGLLVGGTSRSRTSCTLFGRLAFHVPAIHALNGGFRSTSERRKAWRYVRCAVRDGHFAVLPWSLQFHQPAHRLALWAVGAT